MELLRSPHLAGDGQCLVRTWTGVGVRTLAECTRPAYPYNVTSTAIASCSALRLSLAVPEKRRLSGSRPPSGPSKGRAWSCRWPEWWQREAVRIGSEEEKNIDNPKRPLEVNCRDGMNGFTWGGVGIGTQHWLQRMQLYAVQWHGRMDQKCRSGARGCPKGLGKTAEDARRMRGTGKRGAGLLEATGDKGTKL